MSELELSVKLAHASAQIILLERELESERKRGDRWREMAEGYDDLRSELRLCGDDPDGHAEFYRNAAEIISPESAWWKRDE